MEYNVKCPKCGVEQKHLNLEETEGSFVCSKCGEQTKIDLEQIKEKTSEMVTAD